MTMKKYAVKELSCYGYNKYEDIPEEMLDFLPENMESDDEEETPVEKLFI